MFTNCNKNKMRRRQLFFTVFVSSLCIMFFLYKENLGKLCTFGHKTKMTLVLTYTRSGASLIADIIHHSPGDFYISEPLHGLAKTLFETSQVEFLTGIKEMPRYRAGNDIYPEFLYRWFTCNFTAIDIRSLSDEFNAIFTPELEPYYQCIRRNSNLSVTYAVGNCTDIIYQQCVKAKSITLKTVRVSISAAEKLLKWLPSLKIVHVLRDPRGIFQSRTNVFGLQRDDRQALSGRVCLEMNRDIKDFDRLSQKYPIRMRRLVYEQLCRDPVRVSRDLFNFLDLDLVDSITSHIQNITSGTVMQCKYCVNRGNAMKNAYEWIKTINPKYLSFIDRFCARLYGKIGYIHSTHEDFRNLQETWNSIKNKSLIKRTK